jgi:hypothetical protein
LKNTKKIKYYYLKINLVEKYKKKNYYLKIIMFEIGIQKMRKKIFNYVKIIFLKETMRKKKYFYFRKIEFCNKLISFFCLRILALRRPAVRALGRALRAPVPAGPEPADHRGEDHPLEAGQRLRQRRRGGAAHF